MAIFNSYVILPEGKGMANPVTNGLWVSQLSENLQATPRKK